jgi:predicted ATPase
VFITGEVGLGKTTLVREWWSQTQSSFSIQQSALLLESACSIPIGNCEVGRLEALLPWADVVAQLEGPSEKSEKSDSPEKPKLDIKKLLHDSAPAWAWALPVVGDFAHAAAHTVQSIREQQASTGSVTFKQVAKDTAASWAMAIPVIGGVVHAAIETKRLAEEQREEDRAINPEFAARNQQQVFQQYVNLLAKVATETPVIVFLDDLHWADASSCNLLFYLARQISDKRILVIGTYRPEDARAAEGGKGHPILTIKNELARYGTGSEIALRTLGRESIRSMLTALSAAYRVDDKFERWLENISDGNALFVSQFLRTLREDGHLDEQYRFVGSYDTVTIPRSALAVVEERTRRLDPSTRQLLTYATAEGEEFTSYVLQRLSDMKPLELLKQLGRAAVAGVVREKGTSRVFASQVTAVFGFSHALFTKRCTIRCSMRSGCSCTSSASRFSSRNGTGSPSPASAPRRSRRSS